MNELRTSPRYTAAAAAAAAATTSTNEGYLSVKNQILPLIACRGANDALKINVDKPPSAVAVRTTVRTPHG